MKKILVIGAGLSSSTLIKYLLSEAEENNWHIKLGDVNLEMATSKIKNHPRGEAFEFDALNPDVRIKEIEQADFVISMLPARFHVEVVRDCIKLKKNVVTPSYVSDEMKALDQEAKDAGVLIMNEIGVDPGLDHMSAKKVMDEIESEGGKLHIFESFTGGLVAPESDNNPWNYKFTWNPRNVVLAGQGGAAKFIQEGQYKYIPYTKLFRRTEIIEVGDYGKFEGYANRDSLKYREIYGLHDIPTIYRGTLRRVGFSRAWDVFVQLGATDDTYKLEDSENMTYREFINSFLPWNPNDSVELKLRHYLKIELDDSLWDKLVWLGIFTNKKVGIKNATPAQVLQKILEEKWQLESHDKDMIAMWHKFVYKLNGEFREINSHMVAIGDDQTHTAMSNTVGYPCGICTKLMLQGKINLTGVKIPLDREVYLPILKELEKFDINFHETKIDPPVLYSDDSIGN